MEAKLDGAERLVDGNQGQKPEPRIPGIDQEPNRPVDKLVEPLSIKLRNQFWLCTWEFRKGPQSRCT
jgi:hypothetical protein